MAIGNLFCWGILIASCVGSQIDRRDGRPAEDKADDLPVSVSKPLLPLTTFGETLSSVNLATGTFQSRVSRTVPLRLIPDLTIGSIVEIPTLSTGSVSTVHRTTRMTSPNSQATTLSKTTSSTTGEVTPETTVSPSHSTSSNPTSTPTSSSSPPNGNGGGLSTNTKIGLGVGLGVGIPVLLAVIGAIWYGRRRRRPQPQQPKEIQSQEDDTHHTDPEPAMAEAHQTRSTQPDELPLENLKDDDAFNNGHTVQAAYYEPPGEFYDFQTPLEEPDNEMQGMAGPFSSHDNRLSPSHDRESSLTPSAPPISPISPISPVSAEDGHGRGF